MPQSADDYLSKADVWTVLDLIAAEFKSDPASTRCFDTRIVQRAIQLADDDRAYISTPEAQRVMGVMRATFVDQSIGDLWLALARDTRPHENGVNLMAVLALLVSLMDKAPLEVRVVAAAIVKHGPSPAGIALYDALAQKINIARRTVEVPKVTLS